MNFKIPLLDDILKGMPDNARLRAQVIDLHSKLSDALEEIKKLEAKVEQLESKGGMKADTVKVLKEFFEKNGSLSEDYIQQRFNFKEGMVGYHFSVLLKRNFIYQSRIGLYDSGAYSITSDGQEFIVENELV